MFSFNYLASRSSRYQCTQTVPSLIPPDSTVGEYHTSSLTSCSMSKHESVRSSVELRSIHHFHHSILAGNDDYRFGYTESQADNGSVSVGQTTPSVRIKFGFADQMFYVKYVSNDWQTIRTYQLFVFIFLYTDNEFKIRKI